MRALMATGLAVLAVGHTPAMARERTALEKLLVPMPPNARFVEGVAPGTPAGVMSPAQTDFSTGTIYYSQPLDQFSRAHELGHVLDGQVLSDGDRRFFQRLMHAPAGAWNQGSAADTGGGGSEWFADYYAAAATNADPNHGQAWNYAKIGPKRLRRFEQALSRLGRRHALLPYS